MRIEGENISSWKETLRSMSPQERAVWFYEQKLIPSLSSDVMAAEQVRQRGNHRQVQEYFDLWTNNNPPNPGILTRLEARKTKLGLTLEKDGDLIKAGLAGLGRIYHVDYNSQLKALPEETTNQKVELLKRLYRAHDLYGRLNPQTLPPWTIHGGGIFWPGEIAQDQARTSLILGHQELAEKILKTTLARISEMNLEISSIDLKTPKDVLKAKDYSAFRRRKEFLGAFSTQGVLWLRLAELDHNLEYMLRAVNFVSLTHLYEPNPHRLATVAVRTLRATLSLNYHGSLLSRVCGVKDGGLGFIQAFFSSPSATISSLKQFLREKR